MILRPAAVLCIASLAGLAGEAHAQTISTYAGGGAAVNNPALQYSVAPTTLTVDSGGMVYYGNFGGQVSAVYRLNPSNGTLTLVAGNNTSGYSGDGGPATSAQISTICGIAVDTAGDLYIADCDTEVIRRVDASTGIITTVVGQNGNAGYTGDGGPATSATLNSPHGLAIDGAGNLYIADTGNSVIRRVDTSANHIITTVAGNGTAGFSGNGHLAISAELNGPEGVAVDGKDDLYIADTQNNVVRLVTAATGVISAFAGNAMAGYSGDGGSAKSAKLDLPEGVALDSAGDVYIADTFNSVIRFVNASTGIITTTAGDGSAGYSGDGGPATSAALDLPAAVAIDGSGNLYIPDQYNFDIRVVNSGGTISTIAGDMFVSYGGDGGTATGAQLYKPMGAVAIDPSGNLIIPDSSNNAVRRVSASKGIITIAGTGVAGYSGDGGPATVAQLSNPQGIALDAAGDIYIADAGNNLVRRIDASSGNISTVAGGHGCAYSGDGNPATSAQLCFPGGLAFDGAGDLYIADAYNMVIRRIDATTGIITTVAGNGTQGYSGNGGPATSAELSIPNSVAVDGAGNLYIADSYNMVIRKVIASSGEIVTVAGDHTLGYSGDGGPATGATLNYPFGVDVDSAGDIYIADTYNSVVRFVNAVSGQIATIAGNGTFGFAGDGGPATTAEMAYPWGVTLDASGRLFIPDLFNSRIRLVTALQPTFTAQPTTLNFGSVSVDGSSSSMPVTVHNTGSKTLNGSVTFSAEKPLQFSQSNNCAAVAPSASCTINVTFAPTTTGTQTANLYISAAGSTTQVVQLLGSGFKMSVSPTSLGFGSQLRGTVSSSQPVTVTTGSFGPISITSISSNKTQYSQTNNCGSSIPTNSSCKINVAFQPNMQGAIAGVLSIKTGNAGTQTVTLSGSGVVPSVSPSGLSFGNQNRGTASNSQPITVTNGSNQALSMASISIVSTQFSQTNNCGSSVPANSSCTINVVFKPTATGALTGNVSIKTGSAGSFTVTLSGSGVVPAVAPTSLNFGNQAHGTTSSPQPVTITNNGNTALAITSISIITKQFSQTNNCGSSVPANSNCTINVVFSPTAVKALTGSLSIKTVGAGAYAVALSGTGT